MVSRLPGQGALVAELRIAAEAAGEGQAALEAEVELPYGMCSWPPRTTRIEEASTRHVRDQARAILGSDLARSEKFTSSVMDGLDIRETLRNWHTGDLYVKVIPPSRGSVDAVVFLFDVPADPEVYTNRATWYAEHSEESTLAFFATDPMTNLIGPGIAQADYGGALFLYPPRPIPDILGGLRGSGTRRLPGRPTPRRRLPSQPRASRRRGQPPASPGPLAAPRPQVWQGDRADPARSVRRADD